MSTTEAQKRAKAKYRSKSLRFTVIIYPSETELLRQVEKVKAQGEGLSSYVKRLIKEDIGSET